VKRSFLAGAFLGLVAANSQGQCVSPSVSPSASSTSPGSLTITIVNESACPDPGPRVEFEADYLFWWVKRPRITEPLLTTGSPAAAIPGLIGNPDTQILVGPGEVPLNGQSGFRLGATAFLDRESPVGVNVSGFYLPRTAVSNTFASDANGFPPLAQPGINLRTGAQSTFAIADPVLGLAGSYANHVDSSLFGYELNAVYDFTRDPEGLSVRGIAGFRQIGLRESFGNQEATHNINGSNVLTLGGPSIGVESLTTIDSFRAHTNFYGAQIGARLGVRSGRLGADITGKVALGVSDQHVGIDGVSLGSNGQQFLGGVRAVVSNIGKYSSADFAVAPEVGLNVSYAVTERISVRCGYNFLYLSRVVRPTEQIDTHFNPGLVPSDQAFGTGANPFGPTFTRQASDFWVHGLNAGLTVSF
jgi:hypothetical protein